MHSYRQAKHKLRPKALKPFFVLLLAVETLLHAAACFDQQQLAGRLDILLPQPSQQALQVAEQRRDEFLLDISGANISPNITERIEVATAVDSNSSLADGKELRFSLFVPAGKERNILILSQRNDVSPPLPTYLGKQVFDILAGTNNTVDITLRPAGLLQGKIIFSGTELVKEATLLLQRIDSNTGLPFPAESTDANTIAPYYQQTNWATDANGNFSIPLPIGVYQLQTEVTEAGLILDYGPANTIRIDQGRRTQLFLAPITDSNTCIPTTPVDRDRDGFPCHIDCDDNDADNWTTIGCAICSDKDQDGFYSGCDQYLNRIGPDCDDNDADNWQQCASCVDQDKDSYFTGCDRYLSRKGPDCDDADTSNWTLCATCIDGDLDGFYIGCNRYIGIKRGPDCNDADPWNQVSCATCSDGDEDGAYIGCDKYGPTRPFDCNDGNACVFENCLQRQDEDGDGLLDRCAITPAPGGLTIDPSPLEPMCPLDPNRCGPRFQSMPGGIEVGLPPHLSADRYLIRVSPDGTNWRSFVWQGNSQDPTKLKFFKIYGQDSRYLLNPTPMLIRQLDPNAWHIDVAYQALGSNQWTNYGNNSTQLTTAAATDPFIAIAAGARHTLALTAAGEVWAWGDNLRGQCGQYNLLDPNRRTIWQPELALTGKQIVAIAAGATHSAAIDSDGHLWLWGDNGSGAVDPNVLPTPTNPNDIRFAANQFVAAKPIRQVALGDGFTLALLADGTIYAFGRNEKSQLGLNQVSNFDVGLIDLLSNIEQIAAGAQSGYALDNNQNLWGWGQNSNRQLLVDPNAYALVDPPMLLTGGPPFHRAMSIGPRHGLLLSLTGDTYGFGNNDDWQLTQSVPNEPLLPTKSNFMNETNFARDIATGGAHSLLRSHSGTIYSWGANNVGQLGRNTAMNLPGGTMEMIGMPSGANITALAAGAQHSVLLASDGNIWTFGSNQNGQLGRIKDPNFMTSIPQAVLPKMMGNLWHHVPAPKVRLTGVAAGTDYGIAIDDGGGLWSWGAVKDKGLEQSSLDPNAGWSAPMKLSTAKAKLPRFSALAAGAQHGLLLTSIGNLWGFGDNSNGQLGLPKNPNAMSLRALGISGSFRGILTAEQHSIALSRDGQNVWTFGDNAMLRTGQPNPTSWTAPTSLPLDFTGPLSGIAIGPNNGFAWQNRPGSVAIVGWGDNQFKQINTLGSSALQPEHLQTEAIFQQPLVQVCAGENYVLALDGIGRVYAWGSNQNGALADPNILVDQTYATLVQSLPHIAAIACGYGSAVAFATDSSIWYWGKDIIDPLTIRSTPTKLTAKLPKGFDEVSLQSYLNTGIPPELIWQGSRPWTSLGYNNQGEMSQLLWFAQGGLVWRYGSTSAITNYLAGSPLPPGPMALPLVGF